MNVTNSYTPEKTSVNGEKIWVEQGVEANNLPESITIKLLANGSAAKDYDGNDVADAIVTAADKWKWTFGNLPVYANGSEIAYTFKEIEVPGYTTVVDGSTITNTRIVIKLDGSKTWDEQGVEDDNLPSSIEIILYADGNEYARTTATAEDNWAYEFTNLPTHIGGKEVEYTIDETDIPGYEKAINGMDVTNTRIVIEKISGTKTWDDADNQDGKRPASITIILLANGEEYKTLDVTAEDNWAYEFANLPTHIGGKEVEYTIDEAEVTEYTTTIDGYDVTNTHIPEVTSVKVIKVWDDADNQDGMRPEKIEVTLSNGQSVILSEENGWTATIENLPVYANGEKIVYTWAEESTSGYELTDSQVDGYVTTLTNTHTPETINITVTKVWADDDNESGKRPENIKIALLANGTEIETVELTEVNEWKHTFNELPLYESGSKITYTVLEKEVPEGYEVAYEGDMNEGFIIHNVLGKGGDVPPINPQTGDSILLYIITLLISIMGIVSGKLYIKRFN